MKEPTETQPHHTGGRFPGKLLGGALVALAVASLAADLFIDHHGKFGVDGTIGFYAWFGALSAIVFAAAAYVLGTVLGRPGDTYDR
jgi:hypothetical protein